MAHQLIPPSGPVGSPSKAPVYVDSLTKAYLGALSAGGSEPEERKALYERFVNAETSSSNQDEIKTAFDEDTGAPRDGFKALATIWWKEIMSLFVAILALVAIALLLSFYDGKEQPAWKFSLNLSTLTAILSTLLRVTVAVIVAEVISQLKWHWYRRPLPLCHLTYFDQAARGPLGSILLVFRIRRIDLALLGCVIIVLSLAIGPFTQQALSTGPCQKRVPEAVVTLPVAHRTPNAIAFGPGLYGSYEVGKEIKAAIMDGLVNPSGNLSAVSAICPTGNCNFTEYDGITHSSLGLCSRCIDVTSMIREIIGTQPDGYGQGGTEQQYNLTLPNGLIIGGAHMSGSLAWPKTFLNTSTYSDLDWAHISDDAMLAALPSAVHNLTILQLTDSNCTITESRSSWTYSCPNQDLNVSASWNAFSMVAAACTLYPCVSNYHGKVTGGILDERVVNKAPALTNYTDPSSRYLGNDVDRKHFNVPCVVDKHQYTLENISTLSNTNFTLFNVTSSNGKNVAVPGECYFHFDGNYVVALKRFLAATLEGICYIPGHLEGAIDQDPQLRAELQCDSDARNVNNGSPNFWWLQSLYNNGNATFQSIDESLDAIATAITNKIRVLGTSSDGVNAFVNGTAYRDAICTSFHWQWLLFSAVLLLLTAALLVTTIARTMHRLQDVPVWKSSILPLLFSTSDNFHTKSGSIKDIDARAEKTIVTLERDDNTWGFLREGTTKLPETER
ncbi:hypothetical protein FKW77_004803 [Venturia effusa]|uniref:Uncharacterized protein n=1 Tax=Venturia effusa TaxID=50376 RepID=A0A517KZE5_9PEZI|nr:hypothetical protein FKW77_004803 [Venturia effusa]